MAIDYAIVKNSLYQWAVSQVPSGMPVIFYQPNAPRPTVPYITLFLNNSTQYGYDWSSGSANEDGEIDMHGDRMFILQVQGYGNDPLTVMENLRTSLQKQTVLSGLRSNGIAFYNSLGINDITTTVDSQFERRAQMDLQFGIGQVYIDNPGFFDEVEIEEEIYNVNEILIYNEVINVSLGV